MNDISKLMSQKVFSPNKNWVHHAEIHSSVKDVMHTEMQLCILCRPTMQQTFDVRGKMSQKKVADKEEEEKKKRSKTNINTSSKDK